MVEPGGYWPPKAAAWNPSSRMYPRYAPSYQTKIVLEKVTDDDVEPTYRPYGGGGGGGGRIASYYRPVSTAIPVADVNPVQVTGGASVQTCAPKPFYGRNYRIVGYILISLAILTFAFELADVIVAAAYKKRPCGGQTVTNDFSVPWFFSWVVPGLWGSIPIFVTGILALRVKSNYGTEFQALAIIASISAFFFAPAIIAINAAEVGTFMEYCGYSSVSDTQNTTEEGAKFALPIILIVLGILLLLVLLYLTYLLCKSYDECVASETVIVPSKKPTVAPGPVAVPFQPTIQVPVPVPVAFPPVDYVPVQAATLPPPPPRDTGVTEGRLIFMEAHNRGYAYANVPGYFAALPAPTTAPTTVVKPAVAGGYYWN